MLLAFSITLSFVFLQILIGYFLSVPAYRGPVTDHFDGKKFFTPGGKPAKGLGGVLWWMLQRERGPWKEKTDAPFGEKPPMKLNAGVRITFVNHSTFLIQADGVNILTDPVWSERTSPFQWVGPRRMRPPGIRLEDLPKIDMLLLSHNHYDHLDLATVKRVVEVHRPVIIAALGVKAFLEQKKITVARDLDWWEEFSWNNSLSIQAIPAQHFSGRGMFDRDATLWCGFLIKRSVGNIYFVGDTGYNEKLFKEVGERCSPIKVALVPIGAYRPEWFMSPIHCSPAEAVKIHRDLNAKQSVATHFGTFPLADDGEEEPLLELQRVLSEQGISHEQFIVLKGGEGRDF